MQQQEPTEKDSMTSIIATVKPLEGDVTYITSYYEHVGPKQIKLIFIEDEGGWVSEEWLLEQKAKDKSVSDEQLPLFD